MQLPKLSCLGCTVDCLEVNAVFYTFKLCAFVCLLLNDPSNMLVYLRDRAAQISVYTGTLRQKLQIKLPISPSHGILTPG